jgi:hypothetical protein
MKKIYSDRKERDGNFLLSPATAFKLLKVGLQLLQMGSVASMKSLMSLKNPFEVLIIPIFEMTLSILRETTF